MRQPKRLIDLPGEVVRVRCDACRRYGRYKKWKLMKVLGPTRDLDSILWLLAYRTCRRRDLRKRCLAYFEGPEGSWV